MDVAELRSIYSADSTAFDRVTDHVQRRLKETQGIASGAKSASTATTAASREVNAQLGVLKTVEQGRQAFVKSQIDASEKVVAKSVASTKAVDEVEKQSANVRLGFLRTVEAGRQDFVASQIRAAETEARGVVSAVQKEAGERQRVAREIDQAFKAREAEQLAFQARTLKQAEAAWANSQKTRLTSTKDAEKEGERLLSASNQARIVAAKEAEAAAAKITQAVQSGTTKFDSAAFWARQGAAATSAAKVTENETKRAAAAIGSTFADVEKKSTRTTSTLIRDAKTGATITRAELAKIIGSGSKAVEAEAVKVSSGTGKILSDLRRLFLQNNFLFRQLGQRVAGDAGFAAVGVGKLALNFSQLAAASGGAGEELGGVVSAATSALGVFGPLGIAVGVAAVAFAAVEVAAGAAAVGLFLVAKSVSDTEQHFEDLSRQTGLSTDNLQALDIVARQSGSTLDKLVGSVGQLQRKLIDASEGGTSRLSVGLKKLGIDLDDPNRALNQLIDLLIKLPAENVRTGATMQIFSRGGREVAGVIDQIEQNVGKADGALDRLKRQLIDSGIHIDKDGTQTAAKFNDEWIKIEAQLESVKRVVGEEALPTVLRVATQFSDWLARNRVEVSNWARALEHAAEALVQVGINLAKIANFSTGIFIPIVGVVRIIGAEKLEALGVKIGKSIPEIASSVIPQGFNPVAGGGGSSVRRGEPAGEFAIAGGAGERSVGAGPGAGASTDDVAKRIRDAFAQRGRSGGGGGRKGKDPAETARRLAEISLQETLKGLQAEHDALQRQLDLNFVSREKYTQDAINLELRRRQETIAGLQKELAEAENIRKPGQRAVKVAEINARIRDEERRSSKEVQQITDERAAEQLRIGQATAQSQLRIIETQTDQVKARIREQADFRIITEQQAAEFEEKQTLRVFNARERILRQELEDAGKNEEKRNEARAKLDELDAERKAFLEGSSRAITAAIRSDAECVIQFAAQIRDAFQRAQDVRLEAGEANLEPLRHSILTRHRLWDAELQFEITREEERHDRAAQGFRDEADLARIRIKNEQELAQVLAGIHAQEAAEAELHQARLSQLATQAAEQRRQELLQVADDLSSIASDIFDAIGKSSDEFWKSLRQSAAGFAKQIRDELFKGLLEKAITGQAQGASGLIGAIINPLLGSRGPNAGIVDNTRSLKRLTSSVDALNQTMGGSVAPAGVVSGISFALHEVGHGIGQVSDVLGGLFGGGRATGGPVNAGRIYQIHDNEFFRPNVSGKIYNLDQMSAALNQSSGEVRTIVALGDDAVGEAMESHRLTPQGRRAAIVRGRWNRKTGGLQFT